MSVPIQEQWHTLVVGVMLILISKPNEPRMTRALKDKEEKQPSSVATLFESRTRERQFEEYTNRDLQDRTMHPFVLLVSTKGLK